MSTFIETVVLDMAGTTVADDGLVVGAFERAWDRQQSAQGPERRAQAIAHIVATMGHSKIEVFRELLPEDEAQRLNAGFEAAVVELVGEGIVTPIPGAEGAIRTLRDEGRHVVLTTGFSRDTTDLILDHLGWQDVADLVLTPADAGRGRPHPDLALVALLRTRASAVSALAVVGDTEADVRTGLTAGAGYVAGVLTGPHTSADQLLGAGAHEVLDSVAELPEALARRER